MATMPQIKITSYFYKSPVKYFAELYLGKPIPAGMVLVRYKGAKNPMVAAINMDDGIHVHIAKRFLDHCIIPFADYQKLSQDDQFKDLRHG